MSASKSPKALNMRPVRVAISPPAVIIHGNTTSKGVQQDVIGITTTAKGRLA
jgi:hypothetical protein